MLSVTQHFSCFCFIYLSVQHCVIYLSYIVCLLCKGDVEMSFSLISTNLKVILRDCINQLDNNSRKAVSHIRSSKTSINDSVIGFEFFSDKPTAR